VNRWNAMPKRIVFISRRNSLRSVLAQACLAHLGTRTLSGSSCGQPGQLAEAFHPAALQVLAAANIPPPEGRPKSWNELARANGSRADFVVTLDEQTMPFQPSWPGQPYTALWTFGDAAALADEQAAAQAAMQILYALQRRLELLVSLPFHGADPASIRADFRDLAHMG